MAQFDRVTVDGDRMKIMVGALAGAGPHPAILLTLHREGSSDPTDDVVAYFSAAGHGVRDIRGKSRA